MDKKIKYGLLGIIVLSVPIVCSDPKPHDQDYYYWNVGGMGIGKIIPGTIDDDDCFGMVPLIYPEIKEMEEYDDYILAYQVVDIDSSYIYPPDPTYMDSIEMHRRDSINHWLRRIQKLKDCYWIIHKSTQKVYGPLTKREYQRLCTKLDVTKKNPEGRTINVYWVGR